MQAIILLCLGLILGASLLVVIAQRLRIAYPIFLVVAGLLISLLPGLPKVELDPDIVFLVILPPILFDAAQNMSLKALWKWRRIISVMAIGYVLFTALAVAFVAHWLIPGFSLTQGLLLGAIISPPDAAAATSVLRYVCLPKDMRAILEGESLLNDATSLTVFRFALAAIVSSHFSVQDAALGFMGVTLGGVAIGLAFGLLFYAVYKWLPTNADLDVAIMLVIPYVMYLTAEKLQASGVLAVVSGGLFIAYQNHFVFSHSSRLKAGALWSSIVFVLNAVLFLAIGLDFSEVAAGIRGVSMLQALGTALLISLAVIAVRLLSGMGSTIFTRFISRYITVAQANPGWRNPTIVSWLGMRGVVSLASALSIPLLLPGGAPFPHRSLILFITFVVIVVTLVGQGLALPLVLRLVRPEGRPGAKSDEQQVMEIELRLVQAAVEELRRSHPGLVRSNLLLAHKHHFLQQKIELLQSIQDDEARNRTTALIHEFRSVMLLIAERERSELHKFRRLDEYDDDVIRLIENRLDLEEENFDEQTAQL